MTRILNPSQFPLWSDISIQTGAPGHSNTLTTTTKGYDIHATRLGDRRRVAALRRANGNICDGNFQYPMFVVDFELGIQLAGSVAQSQFTRDFYPRNFVQPNYTISGQSLDQEDYGKMCDFIRHIQREALQTKLINGSGLVQFWLNGWGIQPNRAGGPGIIMKSKMLGDFTRYNQSMKGQHSNVIVLGYFNSMPRQHQAGTYSPTWSCEFIVADMLEGPFQENMVQNTKQQTWVDLLNATSTIHNSPALIKEAKSNVHWAMEHSANIINTGGSPIGSGSTSSSGGGSGTYTASMYTGSGGGACGLGLGMTFAELVGANFASVGTVTKQNATALGGLACGAQVKVTYKGKSVTIKKTDIGRGGPGVSGHPRAIDLYADAANALGFPGLDLVDVEVL